MNAVCTICSDLFTGFGPETRTTVCGHLFHTQCLSAWLERSATCPHCRTDLVGTTTIKVYFQLNSDDFQDPQVLQDNIVSLCSELGSKNADLQKLEVENAKYKEMVESLKFSLKDAEEKIRIRSNVISELRENLDQMEIIRKNTNVVVTDLSRQLLDVGERELDIQNVLKAEVTRLTSELEDSEQRSSMLDRSLAFIRILKEDRSNLKRRLNVKKTEVARKNLEISKLNKLVSRLSRFAKKHYLQNIRRRNNPMAAEIMRKKNDGCNLQDQLSRRDRAFEEGRADEENTDDCRCNLRVKKLKTTPDTSNEMTDAEINEYNFDSMIATINDDCTSANPDQLPNLLSRYSEIYKQQINNMNRNSGREIYRRDRSTKFCRFAPYNNDIPDRAC